MVETSRISENFYGYENENSEWPSWVQIEFAVFSAILIEESSKFTDI